MVLKLYRQDFGFLGMLYFPKMTRIGLMNLNAWRNTELHSFQHHPAVLYTASYTGEQPSKFKPPGVECAAGCAREGLPQVHACSFAFKHLCFCVKFFCDDYIFVMIISLQHKSPFLLC